MGSNKITNETQRLNDISENIHNYAQGLDIAAIKGVFHRQLTKAI